MDLSHFDLNLLKTLLVLLEEKNTNKAALRLNTSQPAVSRTLAKIREQFDDPLFIRQSRGLKLTPKAEELALHIPRILNELQAALSGTQFLPEALTGLLRVAMNGFIIETHGYQICEAIDKIAPGLSIELHSYSATTTMELLTGEMDFALSFYPLDISKELRQAEVGVLNYGLICRAGHPLENQTIPIHQVADLELAGLIVPEYNHKSMLALRILEEEIKLKPKFRSQQVNPILQKIKCSDVLFVAPKNLLDVLDRQQYGVVKVNDEMQRGKVKIGIIYNSTHWKSAKYTWLEMLIKDIVMGKNVLTSELVR